MQLLRKLSKLEKRFQKKLMMPNKRWLKLGIMPKKRHKMPMKPLRIRPVNLQTKPSKKQVY